MNDANLTRWVDELQGQIDQLRMAVKMAGGDTVTITPALESGTKVADYTIGETEGVLYAPTPFTPKDYSASEQNTGIKWIDGRDVYTKVIIIGALPNNSVKNVDHGISDIDMVIECSLFAKSVSDNAFFNIFIPHLASSDTDTVTMYVSNTYVNVTTKTNYSNYDTSYAILTYVKTPPVETKRGGKKK